MPIVIVEEPNLDEIPEELIITCEKCGYSWENWDEWGGAYKCEKCGHIQDIELDDLGIDGELGRKVGRFSYCFYCNDVTKNVPSLENPHWICCEDCGRQKIFSSYDCPLCGSERAALIEITNFGTSGVPWDAYGHSWTEHRRCLFCGTDFSFENADY